MNQRFQNEEIRRVREQYAENELYIAVSSIGPQLESELPEFGLCPEECFTEALELLTAIADKGEDILTDLDNIWLRMSNDYRRLARQVEHVNEEEIRKSVGIVFGFTILALDSSLHPFYRYTLSERLMLVVAAHQFDGWQSTLDRIFSVPLPDGWFDAFIDEYTPSASPSSNKKTKDNKAMKKGKRNSSRVKPKTLKYYIHANNSILTKQHKRVDIIFRKWNEWGWIDNKTAPEDFDAFFEGEPKHCNITWTGSTTILTILLQELLKQPYIEKQTGCAAKSLVEQQFGKTANSDRTRLDEEAEAKIRLTLLVLDIKNPLPERRGSRSEVDIDISDAALREVFAGQLRVTKGV